MMVCNDRCDSIKNAIKLLEPSQGGFPAQLNMAIAEAADAAITDFCSQIVFGKESLIRRI